jgi:hypothetical protein
VVTVSGPGEQVHDFEPGITSSGLFWTIPIDGGAVDVSPGSGRARYRLEELALNDYHDFLAAIGFTPPAPANPSHVSFEVTWSGGNDHQRIADTDFDFTGTFVASDARISFTAWNDDPGVVYTSNPDGQASAGAGVGHERNGVFF